MRGGAATCCTSVQWAKDSAAYVLGAALSITLVVTAAYLVAKGAKSAPEKPSEGGEGQMLDAVMLVLLVFVAVNVYRKRNEGKPPKWMGELQVAKPKLAFKLGFLLLGVFPTDIATSITVGTRIARNGDPWSDALGFVGLTVLLLAIPGSSWS